MAWRKNNYPSHLQVRNHKLTESKQLTIGHTAITRRAEIQTHSYVVIPQGPTEIARLQTTKDYGIRDKTKKKE